MPWPSPEFLEPHSPPFVPYIYIATSNRMPSSISMAAATGGLTRTIPLPPETTADDLSQVQERVRRHYREHDGHVPIFGVATAYLFVRTPTEGILLDTTGAVIGHRGGRFYPASVSIQDGLL